MARPDITTTSENVAEFNRMFSLEANPALHLEQVTQIANRLGSLSFNGWHMLGLPISRGSADDGWRNNYWFQGMFTGKRNDLSDIEGLELRFVSRLTDFKMRGLDPFEDPRRRQVEE